MAIVQEAYFIPADIATGLSTGIYQRVGSVVRRAVGPNKGQIVKHLKPIDKKRAEPAIGIGMKAIQFAQQHKKGIAAGTVVVVTVIWGYNKWKNYEPKVLKDFRLALKIYIDAIRSGNMDIEKLDNLMKTMEKLKKHKDYDKIIIQFTTEQLEVLVGRIYDYTIKLANDNSIELASEELQIDEGENRGAIINLQTYLKAQKKIFEKTV